ncbi:hypothetical protein [Streptomyces murinus]|uniref:hypothetical protein n=1 Tax=Streptomyces murinus TaxID=33900 RepID=UPI003807A25D
MTYGVGDVAAAFRLLAALAASAPAGQASATSRSKAAARRATPDAALTGCLAARCG